jgi:hypothetical protein
MARVFLGSNYILYTVPVIISGYFSHNSRGGCSTFDMNLSRVETRPRAISDHGNGPSLDSHDSLALQAEMVMLAPAKKRTAPPMSRKEVKGPANMA